MVICYLVIVIAAIYFAIKLLAPEISKPAPSVVAIPASARVDDTALKIEKLEMMLAEKNKNIQNLQSELKALQAQSQDFDKIKTLLEEEIQHLKGQNRLKEIS